ncbi:MAG: thioesterase family protein [Paracoccaceae bacterium]
MYLIDSDKKKIHLVLEMINFTTKKQVAVCETLLINVDLNKRKSVEYSSHTIKKIEKYKYISKQSCLPLQVGKNLRIKKK